MITIIEFIDFIKRNGMEVPGEEKYNFEIGTVFSFAELDKLLHENCISYTIKKRNPELYYSVKQMPVGFTYNGYILNFTPKN